MEIGSRQKKEVKKKEDKNKHPEKGKEGDANKQRQKQNPCVFLIQ